ncbi:cupin [Cupriavidus sp. 2TAF22]|uniref:cupin n=1 Tax=unclassified Cupriavidus TaxID=2640874 RepID=UPI003F8FB5DC
MKMPRAHIEMMALSQDEGWCVLDGFPAGLEVRVLADDLDEAAQCGARTRLVRFAPGAVTQGTLVHGYWEEVFLISGDLQALDESPRLSSNAVPPLHTYSCRPPGTPHGPFVSRRGCILFEVQYFLPR